MNNIFKYDSTYQGMIVITLLIVMLIVTSIGLSLASLAIAQLGSASRNVEVTNSLLAAEAGAEMTLHELNQDNDFTGYASEQEFFDNPRQGRGTYQTEVLDGGFNNEKIIRSTGRVYAPGATSNPRVVRSVEAVVVGTTALDYSVQTGPGGLIMRNSATIANGDVHVNGFLRMRNSARIGSENNPSRVFVAHKFCPEPPDADFPRFCDASEGEPIDIENPAWIYADVHANNQVDSSGMSHNGLVATSDVEEVPLPATNQLTQKQLIEDGGGNMSASSANCTQNNTTKEWDANTRITGGNVEIRRSCEVLIKGNVWISSGGLSMRNSGTIRVSDDVTEKPIIMIDGASGFQMRNSSAILTNSSGLGVEVITYWSTASCSPNCANVTGPNLYDSQEVTTITLNNSGLAAGSSFYARWTKILVNNGGSVGAVLGQTVELANSGNISFGEELSSGETVWSIKNYRQIFNHL